MSLHDIIVSYLKTGKKTLEAIKKHCLNNDRKVTVDYLHYELMVMKHDQTLKFDGEYYELSGKYE